MARWPVTIISICLCLTTFATAQLSKGVNYDSDAVVDAKTALEKWAITDSRMKSLANEAVKMLLPNLMEATSTLNVSSPCMQSGLKMLSGLRKLKTWAVKFLDASTKSIDGVMGANIASLGAYDECVGHKVINERSGKHKGDILFQGMYCRVEIRPYLPPKPAVIHFTDQLEIFNNLTEHDTATGEMAKLAHLLYTASLIAGICVPSSCSKHDVNQLLHLVGDYFGMVFKATRCEIKQEKEFTPVIIGVIALYSLVGFLLVFSSLVDLYFLYGKKKEKDRTARILCSFSAITNFQKLTSTSSSSDTFSCLHGIRVLSMSWIILCHTYLILSFEIQSIPRNAEERLQEFNFQVLLNGSFSVDTFFFITGMLVCYFLTKLMKIGKKPFNLTMYLAHRLWRIMPCYVFAIAFMFLLPLLGSGPMFHEIIDHFHQSCEKNWWTNILFINNFYDTSNMCFPHGWYLAIDMQLYIGSLVILLPLMRKPKLGISIAVVIIISSMIACAVHTYISDLPPAFIITPNIADQDRYMRNFTMQPHVHAASYCIGLLCGYLLAMHRKIKIPRVVQVLCWSLTLTFSLCVVNGVQNWNSGMIPTFWQKMFYSSCHRVAWSLGVAWVVVACSTGHGGIANNILSWKAWIPLGRLTFLAYLAHPFVMLIYFANLRTTVHYDHNVAVWQFFGHLVSTYLIAVGGTLLVEAPFLSLEKILFFQKMDKSQSGTSQDKKNNPEDSTLSLKNRTDNIVDMKISTLNEKKGINNSGFVYKL